MICNPRIGRTVRLAYSEKKGRRAAPYHGWTGVVVAASPPRAGRRNHMVRIGEILVCVPCGHLMPDAAPATGS
jgi:hypothetical protein